MDILMDFCLYYYRLDGKNAVDRYLAAGSPDHGTEELQMLEAMQRARYSILGIDEVIDGLGVCARDLLRNESLLLVDENMAACMETGMSIAGRLLVFDDF